MLLTAACQRPVRALLVQELADGSGRAIQPAEAAAWPDDLSLDTDGLVLDSLELVGCGTAVNQFFRLHETGLEDYLLAERRLDAWVRIIEAALAEGTSGLTFRTSGSSGAKRPCTHSHASLAAEVAHWAGVFADRRRIIQLVPPHHIYGTMFTVLLPQAMVVAVLDGRALPPGRLARALRADDLLVGFPAGWPSLLRSLESLPAGIRAVSSTAPLPATTSHALRQAGAAEVIEIYGSSETAGIAARGAPDQAFTLLPRWRPGQHHRGCDRPGGQPARPCRMGRRRRPAHARPQGSGGAGGRHQCLPGTGRGQVGCASAGGRGHGPARHGFTRDTAEGLRHLARPQGPCAGRQGAGGLVPR